MIILDHVDVDLGLLKDGETVPSLRREMASICQVARRHCTAAAAPVPCYAI